jgi:PAS domain S-box-containing protein
MRKNPVNVRGTKLSASDTRDQYRQKIARITLDSMVQFVGLLDAQGTVLEINQVALDGVGIKLSDVEGKPFWTTFWWQVSEEINATLRDAIRLASKGEFVRWDTEIYGRAGGKETIIIDASLAPVKDEQGHVVFITAEGRDITEKKAQEREIARQREELAKLDELKTQFFANISHELRTPLTLMLGPIEDALSDRDEPLGDQQRERATLIQRSSLRLQKLVNTLLDFSRAEAGRLQAVYQPTDLASFTQDLASNFRSACEKAGLSLVIEMPSLPEPVFVDHEMWEKIVLNLISNAFKFTPDGGINISLAAEDGHATLRVTDSGTGIPEAELPRIFERFHRIEGARGRTHEGTGIGLALVQELVKLHQGSISVESTVGHGTTFTVRHGTTFTVRIPFGSAHLPPEQIEPASTQVAPAPRAGAFVSEALRWLPDAGEDSGQPVLRSPPVVGEQRPHVVLADDNADMRQYLARLLAPSYDVTAVADGKDALAAAARVHPDLILTDVMMPGLDGFELLRQLRADPELRDIPVIVLSARAGEEAKVEGLRMGANDYLVKPFSARDLLARVSSTVGRARARGRLREQAQQELEGRYRLLVEAVTDYAIYMLDRDGVVTSWNAGARRFKGYDDSEIIGQHFSRFYTEEDRQSGLPARALAISEREGKFEGEGWRVRKNGERFWASVIIDPIRDSLGRLIGYAKVTRDLTERREAQRVLEEARERTIQSQKMEAVGQLTGGIAHDFNNLLAVVLGSLELLQRRVPAGQPQLTRLVDNATRAAQRGAALTQRMLAFARRQELNLKPVDVPALVRGMSELLERSLGPSVLIETRFPLSLSRVTADPNQLEMAVLNLVVNARDAMPDGGTILISARPVGITRGYNSDLEPGEYICLSIEDTGEGMDEATLALAMDPFFTTKELGKGTGLGLPMVQGLAEQSGGRFFLKSRKGEGTTAELWLPVATVEAVAVVGDTEPEKEAETGKGSLVLVVVDDDNLILANMVAMLEDLGHRVFEASSGQQALDILRRESTIDLVITDQVMPQMTGLQLIRQIKAERPDLPVILATGFAELPPDADTGLPRLAKPFRQYDLAQSINYAVRPRRRSTGRVVQFRKPGLMH